MSVPDEVGAGSRSRLPLEGFFLFTAADCARVAAGELTVTWRLWKRAHVKVGRAYPAGTGAVVIDDVRLVRETRIRKLEAIGLTVSLPIGYELSALGQTYLDSLRT